MRKKEYLLMAVIAVILVFQYAIAVYASSAESRLESRNEMKLLLKNNTQDEVIFEGKVKNIEQRYRKLGEETFYLRETGKFTDITRMYINGQFEEEWVKDIDLELGQRIADYLFNIGYEASFLFHADDRSLGSLFKTVEYSKPVFNAKGRFNMLTIKGETLSTFYGDTAILTRKNFKYDSKGSIKAYDADINYSSGYWLGFKIYQVNYDTQGRVISFIYGDGTYGYWEKYQVYNIQYSPYGDIISHTEKYLGAG